MGEFVLLENQLLNAPFTKTDWGGLIYSTSVSLTQCECKLNSNVFECLHVLASNESPWGRKDKRVAVPLF